MATITEFKRKCEESEGPHMSGEAKCMQCKYEWVAVAPIGTYWLECPSCGAIKGFFKYYALRDGDHWMCSCGNSNFYIVKKGIYCPNCGDWQEPF